MFEIRVAVTWPDTGRDRAAEKLRSAMRPIVRKVGCDSHADAAMSVEKRGPDIYVTGCCEAGARSALAAVYRTTKARQAVVAAASGNRGHG